MYIGPWQEMRLAQTLAASKNRRAEKSEQSNLPKVRVPSKALQSHRIKFTSYESPRETLQVPFLPVVETECHSISSIDTRSTAKVSWRMEKSCRGFSHSLAQLSTSRDHSSVDNGWQSRDNSKVLESQKPLKRSIRNKLPKLKPPEKPPRRHQGERLYQNNSGYDSKELCKLLRTANKPDFSHHWKWKNKLDQSAKRKRVLTLKVKSNKCAESNMSTKAINTTLSARSVSGTIYDSKKRRNSKEVQHETTINKINLSQEDIRRVSTYFCPLPEVKTKAEIPDTSLDLIENSEYGHNFLLDWVTSLDENELTKKML